MGRPLSTLILSADRGDGQASEALFSALYRELRGLARRELARLGGGAALGVTSLLHEAYLDIAEHALIEPLGAGGMGSVWLARRNDGRFEGTAAVKLLSAALLGTEGAARFRREGTILRKGDSGRRRRKVVLLR